MSGSSPSDAALPRLLAAAWPEGVPAAEAALARTLAPERAELVASRLAAVLAVEGGAAVSDEAAGLSMDRIAFFRLRKRWSDQRSLRSLTPFLGRAHRRVGRGRDDDAILAETLLHSAGHPRRLSAIADRLMREGSGAMSWQTAMRLVRAAAARLSLGAEEIARELGEEVLVDLTGTAMSVADRGEEVAAVCFVVETATRFILGSATGSASDMLAVVESAMRHAKAQSHFDDVATGVGGRLRVVLPDVDDLFDLAGFVRTAARANAKVVATGDRRYGRQLANLVGHRVGRLSLHPRSLTSGTAPQNGSAPARRVSMADAEALVAEAVRDHNAGRCRQLLESVTSADEEAGEALAAFTVLKPEFAFPTLILGYGPWQAGAARLGATLSNMEELRRAMAARLVDRPARR